MAHPFSNFEKYADSPVGRFIIPIIPAKNADGTPTTLRPTSNLTPDQLGKIPGLWYDDGWTGFGGWQNHRSKPGTIEEKYAHAAHKVSLTPGGDASRARFFWAPRSGHHHVDVRGTRAGNELLDPVEHIGVPVAARPTAVSTTPNVVQLTPMPTSSPSPAISAS